MSKQKVTFTLLLLVCYYSLHAQNSYNLKIKFESHVTDTINFYNIYNDAPLVLLLNEKESVFVHENQLKQDSIVRLQDNKTISEVSGSEIQNMLQKTIALNRYKTRYYITNSDSETIFQLKVGLDYFHVKENITFNWVLQSEEKQLLGYNCKKATARFKGRNYIAWFTPDIPLPFGPYKFKGLPGVILEVSEEKGLFSWTAINISSEESENHSDYLRTNATIVSSEQYLKTIKTSELESLNNFPFLSDEDRSKSLKRYYKKHATYQLIESEK